MVAKRKICVVTGTRAEYGLLRWTMEGIKRDPELELQVIATSMHLSPEFGLTYRQIEADGFHIDATIETLLSSDTPVGISKSMGLGLISFAETFDRLKPDIIVLLGDRFEILAAATAATVAKIPIAHLHGGETTEGLIDEPIRHSVTKMSQIHFTSTPAYRKRVIQLGENPKAVHCVGATGLESILKLDLMNKEELEADLGISFDPGTFLVTYHPVTLESRSEEEVVHNLLEALDTFPDTKFIFTYPNADTSGRIIIKKLEEFRETHPDRTYLTPSLGQLRYLSALKFVDVVIGNSSSALIEVPTFHKASVNIGIRQRGRIAPDTVIHCDETKDDIQYAISKAISKEFQAKLGTIESPYGDGRVSEKITSILKSVKLESLVIKSFYDIGYDE